MAIGIVNKEDFDKEVNGNDKTNGPVDNTSARSEIIDGKRLGRNNKPEVPVEIRNMIAQEALLGNGNKEVAKDFAVSPQSVSAYKHGATSTATYNTTDKRLNKSNNIFKNRIVRRAGRLSLTALDSISTDDFKNASLTDKANVAKQMASIVRDMIPDNERDTVAPVSIQIFAPAMRKESDYIESIVSVD